MTCRSISPETWQHALSALIFYFSRRSSFQNAEDLAQETLATILNRSDYEFDKEEDFLKVCYGFASKVLLSDHRKIVKHSGQPLDELKAPSASGSGKMNAPETKFYLNEVLEIGRSRLKPADWNLLQGSLEQGRAELADEHSVSDANNVRVRIHRARKKLERLTGWKQTLL